MKLITHKDIESLHIPAKLCYKWVEEMLLHKQETNLPPKISMKPFEGVFCNVMPCIVPQNGVLMGG